MVSIFVPLSAVNSQMMIWESRQGAFSPFLELCSVIVTHGVGQLRDRRVPAGAPLQVGVVWDHDLFVFGQVAVQLQHVGAEIHGAAGKKVKGRLIENGDVLKSSTFRAVTEFASEMQTVEGSTHKEFPLHTHTHADHSHGVAPHTSRVKLLLTAWKLPWYFPGSHLHLQSKTILVLSPLLDYLIVWTCSSW